MSALSGDDRVFLETVVVEVTDDYGGSHQARALMDSGSMANFISSLLARRLITPRRKVDIAVSGIGRASQRVEGSIVATIQSRIQQHSSLLEFLVFDASCKTSSGVSLNDVLLVGPVIQDDLYSIMLRFRSRAVALVADVDKMYRQVLHEPNDRHLLRIRYRTDPSEPISTYELQTVTYGTASAPFLATRTLKQIAMDHQDQYPHASVPVRTDFYVDDLLTGAERVSDAIEMRKDITSMLSTAGFTLKKWASNVPEVLAGVPQQDLAIQPAVEWKAIDAVSTLGLMWEHASDQLRFRIEIQPIASVLTKRLVLSDIARIFDILGLLGPTILVGKLFMQRLWTRKDGGKVLGWDTELPPQLDAEWRRFHAALPTLQQLKVPRFISRPQASNRQLHAFADASHEVYGACLYIRSESESGVSVQLLTAKSKVVSLSNTHSIARLKLCGARLATQPVQKVQRSFAKGLPVHYWTDSMTVQMQWLSSPPRRWKPFVCNRVALIQKASQAASWEHVPGVDNPADDISRGLLPDQLLSCQRWWHGPQWLTRPEDCWPTSVDEVIDPSEERADPELVGAAATVASFSTQLFSRFSSYSALQRATAYWLRYIRRLQEAASGSPSTSRGSWTRLTRDELHQPELKLCQLAQQDSFQEEIQASKDGREMPRNSRLKWLAAFLDEAGTLRVGGRPHNTQGTLATVHPIVLSSRYPLAVLLVEAYHVKLLHAGPQLLLATLRQRFWIIGGRSLCKLCFHKCHKCFRTKPVLIQQSVADLPASRVSLTRLIAMSSVHYC